MRALFGGLLILVAARGQAQQARPDHSPPAPCWRFAFGEWTPPLDWNRSGHPGSAGNVAAAVRRIRDSVYVRDSSAAASSAMIWESTPRGPLLLLFPAWWPVGVEVTFDSTLAGGREMLGTAVAMVANAWEKPSKARARAWQVACG